MSLTNSWKDISSFFASPQDPPVVGEELSEPPISSAEEKGMEVSNLCQISCFNFLTLTNLEDVEYLSHSYSIINHIRRLILIIEVLTLNYPTSIFSTVLEAASKRLALMSSPSIVDITLPTASLPCPMPSKQP